MLAPEAKKALEAMRAGARKRQASPGGVMVEIAVRPDGIVAPTDEREDEEEDDDEEA
jgi:hypothetical protein